MDHDGGRMQTAVARTVATWPKGSFAENLAVDADGMIFVTLHTDRAIVRVDPGTGAVTPFATFATPVAGLAFGRDGDLIVSGGTPGEQGGVIWRVTRDGNVSRLVDLADATFLNGVTPLAGSDRMLVAESLQGMVYLIDVDKGSGEPWLVDPRLAPPPQSKFPGVNGLKLVDGVLTMSVTVANALYRTPVSDGRAGRLESLADRMRADDFAVAADGSLFIATHPAHSLVRLAPDGTRTTLATASEGMTGATAVAFGRTAADRTAVYVTTTGGTLTLPPEALEPAKLVRVDVGVAGVPIGSPTGAEQGDAA